MRQDTKRLYGRKIAAADGAVGVLRDFYFDDRRWAIRHIVVDTGTWLKGRLILLPPSAIRSDAADGGGTLQVCEPRERIAQCPSIDSRLPVARQYEIDYYRHYGWPTFWKQGAMGCFGGVPDGAPETTAATGLADEPAGKDRHLCSTRAVAGYQVQAREGPVGRVSGFLVDTGNWTIPQMRVETGQWYSGKEVAIATNKIESINYEQSSVVVGLSLAAAWQAADEQRHLRDIAI